MFRFGIACGRAVSSRLRYGRATPRWPKPGRARQLSRQHHHGLRQLPHAARRRRQADRRQGAVGGGLTFDDAGLRRHRAEHHARCRNRDRKLERCRDQARAGEGNAPGSRPPRRRRRWRRSCRPISTRRCCPTISTPSSPICAPSSRSERGRRTRLQGSGAPRSLSRRRSRFRQGHVCRSGQARRLSRHHRPLHGMPLRWSRGVSDFKTGLGRGGRVFPPREGAPEDRRQHRRQHHLGPGRRHRRLERCRNRPRHHPRRRPRRAWAEAADGLRLIMPG